jgi:phospholipase/carboxylesterase
LSAIELHAHLWVPATRAGLPTLLLLHGTGGDENDLLPLGRMVLPGAAMLSVRGNVLEHGAPRFFRRLAEGVFDLPDLHARTAALADFVAAAAQEYAIAPGSLYALGYSNGANIAASLLLSRPEVLAGGVLLRAMVPFEPENGSPSLAGKHVLVSAGKMDQMIPRAGTERLVKILGDAGADVQIVWQPVSHGLTQGDVEAAQGFFERLTQPA